jgi:hypothetical protein
VGVASEQASQIGEDLLGAAEWGLAIDDPGLAIESVQQSLEARGLLEGVRQF